MSRHTAGDPYAKLAATIPPVPPGKARIYFFRASTGRSGSGVSILVKDGDTKLTEVYPTSIRFIDYPPGPHRFTVENFMPLAFGPLHLAITTEAGDEYYVELGFEGTELMASGVYTSLPGTLPESRQPLQCGLEICAAIESRQEAMAKMARLPLDRLP